MNRFNQRAARLAASAAAMMAEAARLEALGNKFGDDVYEDGNVIFFKKQFVNCGRIYDYVIIKCADRWYTSGPRAGEVPRTWDEIVAFWSEGVDPASIFIVNEWKPLFV